MQKLEQVMVPEGVIDPTLGVYSPTQGSKGAPMDATFSAGMTDIIAGRRPLSDFDQVLKDWVSGGGDQIRNEYAQGIAAA